MHFTVVSNTGSRVRACHGPRTGARVPVDICPLFFKHEHRTNPMCVLLLDQPRVEKLGLFPRSDVKLRGLNRDDNISCLLLRLNELLEVRLSGLDGCNNIFLLVSTFDHVTLDLPCLLDWIGDINVESEVQRLNYVLVKHRVETLDNDDVIRVDHLNRVNRSGVVVVDRLLDCTTLLESLQLVSHQFEVVGLDIQGRNACVFSSGTIKRVEVIKADRGDQVTGWRVFFRRGGAEDSVHATEEGRLSTS
mmetsp:Transcript_20258/g.49699  ORF Transcript_20258/g.49699 Transcript_20258/m.49699 type:complete len:248 (+) Transcript_20258:506-1249(+)